uniref:Zinc finger protein, putative n=1 Tax=Babesia bovis TaxID=5865 RepID=A7ARZ2_BABBO|eukprot:XP_001610879.1 zinc finger protein [Babesia bovis T2Bo]
MFNKRNLSALKKRTPLIHPTNLSDVPEDNKEDAAVIKVPERREDKNDQRATSTYEIDTEVSRDHRSILERNAEIGKQILNNELEDGVYRGRGAYRPVMNVREGSIAAAKYTGLYGPVRASMTNVRTTLRIDYQPDVCKDYKETGYCGFGDSCKFLHDRSDYKSGWQIENEWEQAQAAKRKKLQEKLDSWQRKVQKNLADPENVSSQSENESQSSDSDCSTSDSDSSDDEPTEKSQYAKTLKAKARKMNVPFACLACRKAWRTSMNPIMTTCGHYFCESCSIRAYSRNMKCAKCGVTQDGILNPAQAIIKLLESVEQPEQ